MSQSRGGFMWEGVAFKEVKHDSYQGGGVPFSVWLLSVAAPGRSKSQHSKFARDSRRDAFEFGDWGLIGPMQPLAGRALEGATQLSDSYSILETPFRVRAGQLILRMRSGNGEG